MGKASNSRKIAPAVVPLPLSADLPRFLKKTYDLVEDPNVKCMHWARDGLSLIVTDSVELAAEVLPKHFKHNKFSSFVRQLNTYGFRKIEADLWQFANPYFVRGKRELLKHIHRHKSESTRNKRERSRSPSRELAQVDRENGVLRNELRELRDYTQKLEQNMQFLSKRVEVSEMQQQRFMKFIAQVFNVMGPDNSAEGLKLLAGQGRANKTMRLMNGDTTAPGVGMELDSHSPFALHGGVNLSNVSALEPNTLFNLSMAMPSPGADLAQTADSQSEVSSANPSPANAPPAQPSLSDAVVQPSASFSLNVTGSLNLDSMLQPALSVGGGNSVASGDNLLEQILASPSLTTELFATTATSAVAPQASSFPASSDAPFVYPPASSMPPSTAADSNQR